MNIPKTGIAVDGSTRGNPVPSEYRAVDLETSEIIFHKKIGVATNNITEFIAVAHALLYCIEKNIKTTIYTDSQTALSWIKKGKVNSNLPLNKRTQTAIDYLARLVIKLSLLDIKFDGLDLICNDIIITKWYTSEYGEIPADFGLKG